MLISIIKSTLLGPVIRLVGGMFGSKKRAAGSTLSIVLALSLAAGGGYLWIEYNALKDRAAAADTLQAQVSDARAAERRQARALDEYRAELERREESIGRLRARIDSARDERDEAIESINELRSNNEAVDKWYNGRVPRGISERLQ